MKHGSSDSDVEGNVTLTKEEIADLMRTVNRVNTSKFPLWVRIYEVIIITMSGLCIGLTVCWLMGVIK